LLLQELRSYVMTAAMSVSFNCLPKAPSRCSAAVQHHVDVARFTPGDALPPSSGREGRPAAPAVGLMAAMQLAAYTFSAAALQLVDV